MALTSDGEREVLRALSALALCNPFLPERVENERRVLGHDFQPVTAVWHEGGDLDAEMYNDDGALR